jgi:hypothetical protein
LETFFFSLKDQYIVGQKILGMVETEPTGLYLAAQSTSATLTPRLLLTLLRRTVNDESPLTVKS